jgi:glucosyl-3-phosphoglycerate synthase
VFPSAAFPHPARVSDDDGMSGALAPGADASGGAEADARTHAAGRAEPVGHADEDGGRPAWGPADLGALVGEKGNRHISVCIPARNEAATIGPIVHTIVSTLTGVSGGAPLVDELMVIDDGSDDGTAELALGSGARVIATEAGQGGKGQAMRTAVKAADGDLIVFVDADVTNFGPHFITGLLGPLLSDESATLVKGYYQRPLHGAPDGGGRVTELVARPIIDLLFPHLASIRQPLAGETAAHRWVLEKCGLADGYAVELALLIDAAARFGVETIAQVDLGVRVHRNRPLAELRPQATDILRASLARAIPITPD